MILTGLRTLLLAQSAITDLVGQRVYVNEAAQSTPTPYVVITAMSTDPHLALDGTYGLRSSDVDIDVWGSGYVAARAAADAIREFLDDYTGAITGGVINAVLWQGEADGPIPSPDSSQTGRHLVTVEFQVQYTPS